MFRLKMKVKKYVRLPDLAGATYDAIGEFLPKSYVKLKKNLRAFLDYSDPEKIKKEPPISALILVAPWGLGKTTSYDLILKDF